MTDRDAREWAARIAKPFDPELHRISGATYADSELTRIADAAQYAAAQLFEIRKLLEELTGKGKAHSRTER